MDSTEPPDVTIPPGFSWVKKAKGWELVASGESRSHHLSFRLSATEYASVKPFLDCFATNSLAMRWLLNDSAVKAAMAGRITDSTTNLKETS